MIMAADDDYGCGNETNVLTGAMEFIRKSMKGTRTI